ncbi:MAG: hypothetical protein ACXVBE_03065 [Bdellovibrionota bacterium]
MKKLILLLAVTAFTAMPGLVPAVHADDGVAADVKEGAQDAGKSIRKGARKVKDKTCELVNGKMNCAVKKLKHKAQNAGDEVKDKLN